jgi:hypothetical protein
LKRGNTVTSIRSLYLTNKDLLKSIETYDFDIFKLNESIERDKILHLMTMHMFNTHNLCTLVDESKLTKFLMQIYNGYSRKVPYHNDLHGADVA